MADGGATLMSKRYRILAKQLAQVEGGVRAAARRLGVHPSTFSEHMNGLKNAKQDAAANAVARLHLDWRFFNDPAIGENPQYTRFVGRRVEREEDEPPESLTIWERGAPSSYDPAVHRARMMETRFRFPTDQAWRWGSIFENVLSERPASDEDRASMDDAKREADDLGALKPPKKPPKKRG